MIHGYCIFHIANLPSPVNGSEVEPKSLYPFFCIHTPFNCTISFSRSCRCSTVDPKTPLSPSLLPTGSPSSPWMPTSGRDGCTCIALLSSLNMTCEKYLVVFYYLKITASLIPTRLNVRVIAKKIKIKEKKVLCGCTTIFYKRLVFSLVMCRICLALFIEVCQSFSTLIILSIQACPQTPAHSWKQWTLQHHSVSYLPLCPHITAEGLEQLCAGGGLLIC